MKEKAVADFLCRYVIDPAESSGDPRTGRVVMSKRRLVIAGDEARHTIPLSAIFDVVVGNVPPDLRDLFDDTVTVAHRTKDGGVRTVLVEASRETMIRFVDVLFKCLLNGTEAVTKHPAKVGGRVTDAEPTPAKVSIDSKRVKVATPTGDFEIDVESVIDFDRTDRAPNGDEGTTLVVTYTDGSDVVTSLVAPDSRRKVNLLGRYLRIEYSQVRTEIQEIELIEPEKRVLVGVYATGSDIDFSQILDGNAEQATNLLNSLRDKGLVAEDESSIALTSRGRVIVTQRIEDFDV